MPGGPKGERRPADVIGAAVTIAKIATGEIEEARSKPRESAAAQLGRKGGEARARTLSPEERQEIAKRAASVRWRKNDR